MSGVLNIYDVLSLEIAFISAVLSLQDHMCKL